MREGVARRRARRGLCLLLLAACTGSAERTGDRQAAVHATDVVIEAGEGRVLAGTFTVPAHTNRQVPTVLLLGGSGPQDRDGVRADLPGYRPLRDLADALAASGMAVLRLDDRGVGGSTGRFAGATTHDFADDARQALVWLWGRPVVDRAHIALVGHSEGALVALLVAAGDARVSALVLLGAPSRTGREVARWQRTALVSGDSTTWPLDARRAVLAAADTNAERMAERDPWLRTWFALDPRAVARGIRVPTLLLHGANDRQVPSAQADELAAALRAGGAREVAVQRFPVANHLFLEDPDGNPRGYAGLATRRVRGDVTRAVVDWLHRHAPD